MRELDFDYDQCTRKYNKEKKKKGLSHDEAIRKVSRDDQITLDDIDVDRESLDLDEAWAS